MKIPFDCKPLISHRTGRKKQVSVHYLLAERLGHAWFILSLIKTNTFNASRRVIFMYDNPDRLLPSLVAHS